MTVFVVVLAQSNEFLAVFSTREKAEAYVAGRSMPLAIVACELDTSPESLNS